MITRRGRSGSGHFDVMRNVWRVDKSLAGTGPMGNVDAHDECRERLIIIYEICTIMPSTGTSIHHESIRE